MSVLPRTTQLLIISLLLWLSQGIAAPVPSAPAFCNDPTVLKIERPLYPERNNSPTFQYSFQFIQSTNKVDSTIIVIPGGPGGHSITKWIPQISAAMFGLPMTGFNFVLVDPRGVGCNASGSSGELFPTDAISTDSAEEDVIAIIDHLKLTDYLIRGTSYGTLAATVLAAKIEKHGLPAPRALILIGTIGHAWIPPESPGQDYEQLWQKLKLTLPISIQSQLDSATLPLNLTPAQWGNFIMAELMSGTTLFPNATIPRNILRDELLVLNSNDESVKNELRNKILATYQKASDLENDTVLINSHRKISCTEISPLNNNSVSEYQLIAGGLQHFTSTYCDGISFSSPFDAREYLTTAPIVYINGTTDPATPMWQAEYHFKSQIMSDRYFIRVPDAGHNPWLGNLSDCSEALWKAIYKLDDTFEAALKSCKYPTILEKRLRER